MTKKKVPPEQLEELIRRFSGMANDLDLLCVKYSLTPEELCDIVHVYRKAKLAS